MSKNNICLLPLDFEELPSLEHLLASSNRISELPEKLGFNDKLITLDMYDNMLIEVNAQLIKGGIVRCDFAMNHVNFEHLDKNLLNAYQSMEEILRKWEEDLGEDYVCTVPDGKHRSNSYKEIEIDTRPEKTELWDEYYTVFDDQDFERLGEGEKYEDRDNTNSMAKQESAVDKSMDEEEGWASEEDIYDLPPKFFFRFLSP